MEVRSGESYMPHHPHASRKVEKAISWLYVALNVVLFLMLDQGTYRTMNDTLGFSCGS